MQVQRVLFDTFLQQFRDPTRSRILSVVRRAEWMDRLLPVKESRPRVCPGVRIGITSRCCWRHLKQIIHCGRNTSLSSSKSFSLSRFKDTVLKRKKRRNVGLICVKKTEKGLSCSEVAMAMVPWYKRMATKRQQRIRGPRMAPANPR